jgi:UPF0271 protein
MKIDLNCDMGESFGAFRIGMDEAVMPHITSSNIACGFHAGDPVVMERTVTNAKKNGIAIGAHPGYPDLMGFGRRKMICTSEEIAAYVTYQIGALKAFAAVQGLPLQHVKPHGALYNAAQMDTSLMEAICRAVASVDTSLIFVGLAGKWAEQNQAIAESFGLHMAFEAFPDRAYTPEGALQSRKEAGAVIKDPETVARRALKMAKEGKVVATDGSELSISPDTLCVHGDTPGAVALVSRIHQILSENGVEVVPMGTFL